MLTNDIFLMNSSFLYILHLYIILTCHLFVSLLPKITYIGMHRITQTVKVLQFYIQIHLIIKTTFDKQYPAFTILFGLWTSLYLLSIQYSCLCMQSHLTTLQLAVYTQNSSSAQFYRNAQDLYETLSLFAKMFSRFWVQVF